MTSSGDTRRTYKSAFKIKKFLNFPTRCSFHPQAVCGQRAEGGLHQCGRVHLPRSLREGSPYFAIAARGV